MQRKHRDLQALAERLMDEHGLDDWSFRWTPRATRQIGVCMHRTRELGFAPWLADAPVSEQQDTVLHEIAHALAGHAAKHGPIWRAHARRLGARPSHCTTSAEVNAVAPKGKWVGTCSVHGEVARWHRQPQRVRACGKCSRGQGFKPEHTLTVRHEDTGLCPTNRKYTNELATVRSM